MTQTPSSTGRMFLKALGTAAFVALGALSTPAASEGFPVDADGYRQLRIAPGVSTGTNVFDVLVPFLQDHPEALSGNPALSLEIVKVDGALKFDLFKTGYRDDSVSGEHFRGTIIQTTQGWEMIDLSVKPLCYRGEPTDGQCP
ncbi:MAG: hypothetical protein ABJN26_07215 [Stappiaceae bacterium]